MRRLMDFYEKNIRRRQKNSGSAMVTVIVAILFVTVLATMMLYVSGVNYQIKQTDYANKKNFYICEKTMENIKAQLMLEVSEAAEKAYADVAVDYVKLGSGDVRQWEYNDKFVEYLEQQLRDKKTAHGSWVDWLCSYKVLDPGAWSGFSLRMYDPTNGYEIHSEAGKYTMISLNGVEVTYTSKDGHTACIKTDFYMQAPEFNWMVEQAATIAGDADAVKSDPINVASCVNYVHWEMK